MDSMVEREAAMIARKLGKRQRAVVLRLSENWGPSGDYKTAKAMWYGVGAVRWHVIDHKHRTHDCWCLNSRGLAVKAALSDTEGR